MEEWLRTEKENGDDDHEASKRRGKEGGSKRYFQL